jgi:hypothetical protein
LVFGVHDEDIFPGSSLCDLDISMLRISLEHLQTSSCENFTMELYIASSLTSKSGSDSGIGTDFSDSSKVLEVFEVSEWALAILDAQRWSSTPGWNICLQTLQDELSANFQATGL